MHDDGARPLVWEVGCTSEPARRKGSLAPAHRSWPLPSRTSRWCAMSLRGTEPSRDRNHRFRREQPWTVLATISRSDRAVQVAVLALCHSLLARRRLGRRHRVEDRTYGCVRLRALGRLIGKRAHTLFLRIGLGPSALCCRHLSRLS